MNTTIHFMNGLIQASVFTRPLPSIVVTRICSMLVLRSCLRKGLLPEKLGGSVRPASQNPYPIYDLNKRFDKIFMAVAADTVALNIIMKGFC